METNIVICLFIGLPGSGKTTLIEKLTAYLNKYYDNTRVIKFVFDNFLPLEEQSKLVVMSKNDAEEKVFKSLRNEFAKEIENAIENIKRDDHVKYIIMIDDNFYYKSMRYKFYQVAAKFTCGYTQVYLDCCLDLALERNKIRSNRVDDEAIKMMNKKMEVPNKSYQWEIESFTLSSLSTDKKLDDLSSFIIGNFQKGRSTVNINTLDKIEARNINLKSLLHRSDLILRTLVSETIQHKSYEGLNKRDLAKLANKHRQEILSKIKNKTLKIPYSIIGTEEINELDLQLYLSVAFKDCFSTLVNS